VAGLIEPGNYLWLRLVILTIIFQVFWVLVRLTYRFVEVAFPSIGGRVTPNLLVAVEEVSDDVVQKWLRFEEARLQRNGAFCAPLLYAKPSQQLYRSIVLLYTGFRRNTPSSSMGTMTTQDPPRSPARKAHSTPLS